MDAKRKELTQQYKERKITGGVYLIRNPRGKSLLETTADMGGSRNRFDFSVKTGSCANKRIQDEWEKFGAEAFTFEVLDEIEKDGAQSVKEFEADLAALKEIWLEKLSREGVALA